MRSCRFVAAAALAFAAATTGAQTTAAASPTAPVAKVRQADANAEMSAALRNLITLQEQYWSTHGSYTTDGVALGVYPTPKDQLAYVQVIFAGSRGWTGVASYRGLKGKSCVVYVGIESELPKIPVTMADKTPAKGEGQATCDAP